MFRLQCWASHKPRKLSCYTWGAVCTRKKLRLSHKPLADGDKVTKRLEFVRGGGAPSLIPALPLPAEVVVPDRGRPRSASPTEARLNIKPGGQPRPQRDPISNSNNSQFKLANSLLKRMGLVRAGFRERAKLGGNPGARKQLQSSHTRPERKVSKPGTRYAWTAGPGTW